MKKLFTLALITTAALFLAACSFNPVGESTFDCNRKTNPSKYCRSFKSIEKSTNGALPESRFDKEFKMSDYDQATGIAPEAASAGKAPVLAGSTYALPHNRTDARSEVIPGAPVRRAPVIQRVLVKKFVDENDMLQGDVVVYKEVQSSKWTGFDTVAGTSSSSVSGAYPHRRKDSPVAGAEADTAPASPGPSFNQPEANAEGLGGTVMPPTASGSK